MQNETIVAAFEKLRSRVLPAVLDSTSVSNGQIMKAYLESRGFDFENASDDTLANGLYEACVAETSRLKWLVKPAKLKVQEERGIRNTSTSRHEEKEFVLKVHKSEADEAYAKGQTEALRQITELIENFTLVDGFTGRIRHGQTEVIKERARKHLAKAQADKRDLSKVAAEISRFFQDTYEHDERSRERV
jgi:hypothetical protein